MSTLLGKLPLVARAVAGFLLTLFGLNGFLHFLPMPPAEGAAAQFFGGLAAAGYFYPLLYATELGVGLLLLIGRFVPLALVIFAPVIVNIVGFHLSVDLKGLPLALLLLALELYLVWVHQDSFKPVLRARAVPTVPVDPDNASLLEPRRIA